MKLLTIINKVCNREDVPFRIVVNNRSFRFSRGNYWDIDGKSIFTSLKFPEDLLKEVDILEVGSDSIPTEIEMLKLRVQKLEEELENYKGSE